MKIVKKFKSFPFSFPVLYPAKTPSMLCFSGVFRGYLMGTLTKNELKAFKRVGYVGLLHRHKFYDIFLEIVLPYFVFS